MLKYWKESKARKMKHQTIYLHIGDDHQGRLTNTPTSYSGGPMFKSRSVVWLDCLKFFFYFIQRLQANTGIHSV